VKGAEVTPELSPPTKSKKMTKKARKAAEEETARKRQNQRRSTSDLIGRQHHDEGSFAGREMRAQALAKQSATLKTISETQREVYVPKPRRKSMEYNGRPSVMLGAEVSRAMKWADSFDKPMNGKAREERNEMKTLPEKPPPQKQEVVVERPVQPVAKVQAPPTDLRKETVHEIPREPKEPPKVAVPRPRSPESKPSTQGPVLLPTDSSIHNSSIHKSPEKPKSPPSSNKFKKFFGGKSKEEKAAKRVSRAMSPVPLSPTPVTTQPQTQLKASTLQPPTSRTPEPRAPSPVQPSINLSTHETREWEDEFDGTHRMEPTISTTKQSYAVEEDYRPATPPAVPTFRSSTPTRERTSEDDELDRWAQIRKAAGQRALHRNVAPPKDDEIAEVNIPRIRNTERGASPKRVVKAADEEDEESVDARVARIRKRVQELTAGMGDDD
jgi:hypothetical protein